MILQKKLLFLTVLLAIVLRIYALDRIPPSLFSDEVDVGYQAYSLFKTGRDYSGNFLPIHLKSFADFRAPLYIYFTIPFVAIFELSEWAVRLPAAIFGILSVILLYFLAIKLKFNSWVALLSSFSLAISPWSIHYSRAGFEVSLMLLLIILGLWLFLKGLEKEIYFILSLSAFTLAVYTYSTAKLFIPLFGLALAFIFKKQLFKLSLKWKIGIIIFLTLLSMPLVFDTVSGKAGYRFSYTNIFADPTIPKEIDVQRNIDTGSKKIGMQPTILSKINHNKVLSFWDSYLKNYLSSFSTQFLFLDGDPIRRHSVGKMGQFYLFEAVTIFIGLFILFRTKTKAKPILLIWLFLAPIPASLTVEGGNHATRLILLLVPLLILSGLGLETTFKYLLRKSIKEISFLIIFSIISASFYFYVHRYFIHYPLEQERIWHFGFKQAILKTEDLKDDFDNILFTTSVESPLPFILFWTKYPPEKFQHLKNNNLGLGKYIFGSVNDKALLNHKILIVAAPKDLPKKNLLDIDLEGFTILDNIKYPSGETVFMILTKND